MLATSYLPRSWFTPGPPSIFASVSLYDRVRDDSAEQNDWVSFCEREGGFQVRIVFNKKKWELIIRSILTLFNLDASNELSSQAVARQVFSPL